ncbi:Potassium transporter 10 [Citrus sinensis]|uniref:Potassium transporter 10 n=1 Tax=Citrus sinensis TaxID=2711 RepID=A0ACB8NBQ8_CITSI|nr:Potassium transporter 10 [Citrus sinensis]
MGSEVKSDEDTDNKGQVWFVNHKFDHLVDEEAERHSDANVKNFCFLQRLSALLLMRFAFKSLGVVYGDLGTSPMYVLYNTFPDGIKDTEDVIDALSLIIYTLTIIPLIKYVLIVCRANDNGQVLSAAGGVKLDYPKVDNKSILNEKAVVLVAVAILVVLFSVQHFGVDKVGWLFAPIVFVWFLLIGGTEALFADVCQFPVLSIQIAFATVVYPCLLLAYIGQAAYLMKKPDHVHDVFYRSIPDIIYWPVFVVATAAAVVASQATISATFSLIKQAVALGCFPRVKVMHTSKKYSSHIYIPEINWILMILCVAVTAGFKNQHQIGNACGMFILCSVTEVYLINILSDAKLWIWFCRRDSNVGNNIDYDPNYAIHRGGWVPLVIAAAFFISMSVWHYGTMKRHQFELQSKVPIEWILGLGPSLGLVRVPGVGLVYSELANGVPHIFAHFITNLPAIHSVVIFVCVKYIPVYAVPEGERFLVKRVGPKSFHMFHCVARYGYKDLHKRDDEFEKNLFENLFRFMRLESLMDSCMASEVYSPCDQGDSKDDANLPDPHKVTTTFSPNSIVSVVSPEYTVRTMSSSQMISQDEIDELEFLTNIRATGVVHILGKTVMMARRDSEFYKKILIDYIFTFLRKICRENNAIFYCPRECLLNVGQVIIV